jgi:hypothetical protein
MDSLKIIEHDGGLFSFLVPNHWEHQIEDDGNQVFWDETAGSGTLRVSSLTAQRNARTEELPQVEILSSRGVPTLREDGVAWLHYRRESEEDGHHTVMFWWELANFIPPCYARLAFFSFTIYADEELQPETQKQLQTLAQLPSLVKFGQLQGFEK